MSRLSLEIPSDKTELACSSTRPQFSIYSVFFPSLLILDSFVSEESENHHIVPSGPAPLLRSYLMARTAIT